MDARALERHESRPVVPLRGRYEVGKPPGRGALAAAAAGVIVNSKPAPNRLPAL